jgi:predicted phosphodiesterase
MALAALSLAACSRARSITSPPIPPEAELLTPSHPLTVGSEDVRTATPSSNATISPTPTPDVFAMEFPLAEVEYLLPLTMRHVSPSTAVLFFELANPVNGYLFFQVEDGGYGGEIPLATNTNRHLITLEGLLPGETYKIRVGIDHGEGLFEQPGFLGERWGPVTVRTPSEGQTHRFGVIGDASFGDTITASLVERMAQADLDFVVHTGDVVDETEVNADPFDSYVNKYYAVFAPLLQQMPVYTVPGNHDHDADIRWQGEPFYYHAFPPFEDPLIASTGSSQYYAFSKGNLQFIMLDSQVFYGVAGREEQLQWLVDRLNDGRFSASIPVFHVSPYTSSAVHRNEGVPVQNAWAPLFAGANVPVVFSGHTHQYERLLVGSVTYIVSGGGSEITYARGALLPQSQLFARKSHFVLAEMYPDRLELTSVSMDGRTIDQVTIMLP